MQYIKVVFITYDFYNNPKQFILCECIGFRTKVVRETWMWQINQTLMVPPMGLSFSFSCSNNDKVKAGRAHLHSHPLNLILHQRLATRTLFVMLTSFGKSFKIFINHLAPNISMKKKKIHFFNYSLLVFLLLILGFFLCGVGLISLWGV